jgi:4-amino-4-deoxy-L-arabinose transferase-like glycosyltransferase
MSKRQIPIEVAASVEPSQQAEQRQASGRVYKSLVPRKRELIVIAFAAVIFFGCIFSPPSLMDDVDAVQAQISRNMLLTGDWTTARLDGVPYMEKAPLKYWLMAASFMVFGVHDWAARIPIALSAVLLCWVVVRFAAWAFGEKAAMYAGLTLGTCVGLFLFTRILIPDCMLALAIATSIFAMARLLEDGRSRAWPALFWSAMAAGVLLKGLIGALFPAATAVVYVTATGRFLSRDTWKRFRPGTGIILFLAIALPWHVLAAIRNPPVFDFTLHSESGSYRGFLWFYFINEQVLRFLNRRYPRDYDTVPRLLFWGFHFVWLFPWSLYLPALLRMDYRADTLAGRARVLALCWAGVVLVFFSLSTTQEYYSLPCYPAFALLIGSAIAKESKGIRLGTRMVSVVAALATVIILAILYQVRHIPAQGDIAVALEHHPDAYTMSMGHMGDLTLKAFAHLRLPLALAALAFAVGAIGGWLASGARAVLSFAVMMVLLFYASRTALVVFDPYLSSRELAEALIRSPEGKLVVNDPYWEFSSVFFYSNRPGLLLNGRRNNLEYGSYSPGAANVFIGDDDFVKLWNGSERCYVVSEAPGVPRLGSLVGLPSMHLVLASGGKYLFSNME